MSIKVYQSKQGKKLYEVYVGIKARGKMLQRRRRKDFKGNFISSLPNKWTPKFWDEMKLEEFTKMDIHKLIFEDMLSSTPHQKKDVHKILRRFFEMAVEEGVINKNPAKGIKIKLPSPEQKILTSEEADRLLKEAHICNHRFYPHWAVALFTGMRNGEIYALRVSDVDLDAGIIHIKKQFTAKDGLHETKTSLSRVVPIADELKPLLEWYIEEGGYKETLWKWKNEAKQEQVFFVWDNLLLPRVREWKQGEQSRFLRDFCKGIGIPEVRFHDLRATFITNMLSRGAALNVVMSIVGHRKIATTDVYNRLAGVGVKGSTDKLSYGLHFQKFSSQSLIPFVKRKR